MISSFLLSTRRLLAFTLLIAAVLCASGSASPVADDTISIGVVLPISGREGKPGQFQKEGIELAIKKINDAGGLLVNGKKMKLKEVFYDDGSDSAKSAALAERAMSSDNVTAVLGGYSCVPLARLQAVTFRRAVRAALTGKAAPHRRGEAGPLPLGAL